MSRERCHGGLLLLAVTLPAPGAQVAAAAAGAAEASAIGASGAAGGAGGGAPLLDAATIAGIRDRVASGIVGTAAGGGAAPVSMLACARRIVRRPGSVCAPACTSTCVCVCVRLRDLRFALVFACLCVP